jgi:hypothetical protein
VTSGAPADLDPNAASIPVSKTTRLTPSSMIPSAERFVDVDWQETPGATADVHAPSAPL